MKALWAQCKAEALRGFRNKRFLLMGILFPAVMYLFVIGTLGDSLGAQIENFRAYYLIPMIGFGLLNTCFNLFGMRMAQERTTGWTNLLTTTPLSPAAYIGAKMITASMQNLIIIVLMFLLGQLLGVRFPLMAWINCGLWLFFSSFAFLAIGSLIGTSRNVDDVQGITILSLMLLGMLGGIYIPIEAMSDWMRTIAQFLPSYHFVQGAWAVVAENRFQWVHAGVLAAYFILFAGLATTILTRQEAG